MIQQQDWDQLINQARVKLTGASDKGLYAEFYDVLTEFLNDTSLWKQSITVPYTPNTLRFPLFVSEGQMIRLNAVFDWGPVVPSDQTPPANQAISFVPALMTEPGVLSLKNAFNTSGYLQVNVTTNTALPTDKHMVPDAPSWLLPMYHVDLLDGLLGKMMTQVSKSYSNEKQGLYHLKRFRVGIGKGRSAALRNNTVSASAWRFPQQFRSTSQQSGVPAIGSANERSF